MRKVDNLPPSCAVVIKSGNVNFLEPSRPLQACSRTALLYDTSNDLLEIPYHKDLKFVSFDIINMYSKHPVKELIEAIK